MIDFHRRRDCPHPAAAPEPDTRLRRRDGEPYPHVSQYATPALIPRLVDGSARAEDDPAWATTGACCPAGYAFWAHRMCGVAALAGLVEHRRGERLELVPTAEDLLDVGGYVLTPERVHGLVYAPLVELLRTRWGIGARVAVDLPAADLAREVAAGALAIASVHPAVRRAPEPPPARGGHLVTLWAADDDGVRLTNPSGLPGHSQHARLPVDVLARYYAGRAVLVEPA